MSAALCGGLGLALIAPLSSASGNAPAQATGNRPAAAHATTAVQGSEFQNLNGFMWYYNNYFDNKFKDIEKDLDNLKSRGIRVLGFFTPYQGNKANCDGCSPVDFYRPSPQSGSMQDWNHLVAAAHGKGMKVVTYMINIYMDETSPFFKKAEKEYAAGDRTSREVSSFAWTKDPNTPVPNLNPQMASDDWTGWKWSKTAGAYYWKLWFGPGFDFTKPGGRTEVDRMEKFWFDTGIDGVIWDVGTTDERWKHDAIDLPKSYTPNEKWLAIEQADSGTASVWQQYGVNTWHQSKGSVFPENDASNDYSRIVNGTTDADALEEALRATDTARAMGATTYAWSIWGDDPDVNLKPHKYPTYPDDDVMRVQEAALLAGAGITYGSAMNDQYIRWSKKLQTGWGRVLQTVNSNAALLPSASRSRVTAGFDTSNPSSGLDPKVYAMRRTSADGKQTALLLYNFHNTAAKVSVDLDGTGIRTKQTPKDLYNGGNGPAIDGRAYTVDLPAYGFKILQVSTTGN